jgi:hypothetical protein
MSLEIPLFRIMTAAKMANFRQDQLFGLHSPIYFFAQEDAPQK